MFVKKMLVLSILALSTTASAEETLAVVGSWSNLPLNQKFEQPFWKTQLAEASNGKFSVQMTTVDQMGIGGADVYRMLGDGVFDVGMTSADYAVSDAPALEALDVPLIANDVDQLQKVIDAARPMVDDIFAETFNAKVLAIAPYPPQVVFCKSPVTSLADLKGLKIRASGRMTAKFLEALGAQSVNISFGEVPGALQRGVINCAVTGSGSGYSAGWWEVTTHLMTLPLGGWDPVVTAMNQDKWNALSKEDQILLQTEVKNKFETPAWEYAKVALVEDVACLTGNGECSIGPKKNLVLVTPSEEDLSHAKDILQTKVLPEWAERAGENWAKKWDDSVGKIANLASMPKG